MKFNHVTLNMPAIQNIEKAIQQSLVETAEVVREDVQQSKTMPFDTGHLQKESTFVNDSHIDEYEATIVSDTPYARRVYFHPEFHFNHEHNPYAGANWFEPYKFGVKKDFAQKEFSRLLRGHLK